MLKRHLPARPTLVNVVGSINAAKRLNAIFIDLKQPILDLFEVEQMTIYAVDPDRRELYSRFLDFDTIEETRIPIDGSSVAGYVAHTGRCLNIADAYDASELARIDPGLSFDASGDRRTGIRTRQILAVPILRDNKYLRGVIQLLNKKRAERFTSEDERNVVEMAQSLATALSRLHRIDRRRPGKFDYLLIQDLITPEELSAAITVARHQQTDVESILLNTYRIRKDDIGVALCMFYKRQFVEFSDQTLLDPALLNGLRIDYLKVNCWVPLARRGKVVDVLIDNPLDVQKVDNVKRMFPDCDVRFLVGLRPDILQFIESVGRTKAATCSFSAILGELVDELPDKGGDDDADDADLDDRAVVRLAHQLIIDGHRAGASDIHIEPRGATQDTLIRFRVDGECIDYQRVPAAFRRAIVARLKIMARLDITERRKPQDGRIVFQGGNDAIALRVATLPTAGGNEDVAMRFVALKAPIALGNLGMTERNLREITRLVTAPCGLILCVGPTGSGKTTTLHALLAVINRPGRRILTAEDPVEITQDGLRQVQVQPKIGFTFAAALRAFLRADPDVIMIGEMRDQETATTAVEASLTGHLVLSTLHTNSAAETVVRLLDMGVDSFTCADAMLGVVAQRLVKCICQECKEAYRPTIEVYEDLVHAYGRNDFEKLGVADSDACVLYRGRGCAACNRTGYKGRTALHELLLASDEVKVLIQTRAPAAEILRQARAEGMTTLMQDGILKSLHGVTDLQQVRAVARK